MKQSGDTESRRAFLKNSALAALALPFLINCKDSALAHRSESDLLARLRKNAMPRGAEGRGAIDVPDTVSWKTVLAKETDPGEPMIVSGTVFQADRKTPAPDVLIYFYHTDAEGIYGRKGEPKHGKYRGWLLTDARGRYEFRSIKPASYPNSTISSHVHMTLTGIDFREDSTDSILFEGDRFITAQERDPAGWRGGFNPIIRFEKDAGGILRGVRDIRLRA